ncbi:CYTH and CHAD domain-containing protein [Pseudonocardia eucalypti]|uniref:CYTH and CHAD domain-containing protein n=1 Tax=Pseudonocardia eucalypti TaxID=648755 RepID=A0ABP9QQT2_9PSEU|nr:CHAD domain-containing protein [Pseudonocardia eucalypti]
MSAVTTTKETERKYETDRPISLPEQAGPAGLSAGSGPEEQRLAAVYFDTGDLRLLRGGVTLRRREGGHDEGWHLKLPAGGDSRDELRLPLGRGGPHEPPAELVSLTRLRTRGAELAPVAELDTERRRWVLADSGGRVVAELVEDRVRAHTLGASTSSMSWSELEVELAEPGRVELLDRIERDLLRHGAHRSAAPSKLARVLGDQLPRETKRRKTKRGSAGEAVLEYLDAQAERLRAYDPLVRQDAPDAVHQMRVAARRMRSGLQAYRRVLDRAATEPLVDELRWLGNELGDARDSEVIEERLAEMIDALPAELVMGPVAAHTTRQLQRRRALGRERAIAALDSDRYLALHDAIDRLLADPPLTGRAKRPAKRELPKSAARAWRRTAKRMDAADRASGEERDRGLHETRKAAKRMRYAVEVAAPSVGKPAKRLRKLLKGVHSLLGDHQDAVVARPVIRELAGQAHSEGGNGFTHGVMHGLETRRAEQAERDLPAAWRKLNRRKRLKWLKS